MKLLNFRYIPRWRNVPATWTEKFEFEFFKEISLRGWGICPDILKDEKFNGAFDGEPPAFVTADTRVMKRLSQVFKYIEDHTLESLRQKEQSKPVKRVVKTPTKDIIQVPPIDYDEERKPIIPIQLTASSYVLSLGTIVTDRVGFHNEKYIFPAGFKSTRRSASTLDPTQKVRWNCEIIDTNQSVPLFRVSMEENPTVCFEGNSPTSPWTLILKILLSFRSPENNKGLSISGPEHYGLANPQVMYLIQNMEGADRCVNYVPKQFVITPSAIPVKPMKRKNPDDDDRPPPGIPLLQFNQFHASLGNFNGLFSPFPPFKD